jgi:hypothetical protein
MTSRTEANNAYAGIEHYLKNTSVTIGQLRIKKTNAANMPGSNIKFKHMNHV